MTGQEQKVIDSLRAKGFAVVLWTPTELHGLDPKRIENIGVDCMGHAIAELADNVTEDNAHECEQRA